MVRHRRTPRSPLRAETNHRSKRLVLSLVLLLPSKYPAHSLTSITAGGSAYYFAKRSITEERNTKYRLQEERNRRNAYLESQARAETNGSSGYGNSHNGSPAHHDTTGSPSSEANNDPAPTRHAPQSEQQRLSEKSKFEASEPYRSRKGDRFS